MHAEVPAPAASSGIAILGGTFDPPHHSHRRLAEAALAHLPVSEVRVIPAGDHPHKVGRGVTPATHRLAMCRLAFADMPRVQVDDRELRRAGLSFTVDTLAELHAEFPDRHLWFLIGSDNLVLLPTWRDHHRILALATVVTYPRAGHPIDKSRLAGLRLTADEQERLLAHVLPLPADAVAATDLRARWQRGERDLGELAPAVQRYILDHRLYRDTP